MDNQNRHTPHTYNSNTREPRRRGMKPAHKSFLIWHVLVAGYFLFNAFTKGDQIVHDLNIIDLSHVFDNTTIYWVTEPTLKLNVTYNGTIPEKNYWYQKEEISAATHGGTHLDAPCHFARGQWCVSDIPLTHLVVPAVVVDISAEVDGNPDVHLSSNHLIEWEKIHGHIPDRSLLLIYTGWSRFWPHPLNYTGTEERDKSQLKFPSIQPEAASWLVANRKIVGIGLDSMSVDIPNSSFPGTHVTLMEKNIYALENVNNLQLMPPTGATVFVMPMKLKGASGAPCRIFAQLPGSMTSGGSGYITFGSSFALVLAVVVGLILAKI
ncbi:Isatin hydrolase like protein [Argiope bruennichi]|uniref:Isatin hydrolase like protein n=1 Tax=Argiope bruennichi TaxID=94029 RepID=A0A8T0FJZ2_ARGBR|nr:Isatin hydrolase like protein [Argiope bruennichi]